MPDVVSCVSPGSFLARFFSNSSSAVLALITGPSGSGKTRWCQELSQLAAQHGLQVCGLLSPPIIEDNQKSGIGLVDLSSGVMQRLADRRSHSTAQDELLTQAWRFDREVLAWGNQVLAQTGSCDVLIIDELGPLELERGLGFQAGLALLEARRYRLACVVVRPSLLPAASRLWPGGFEVWIDDSGM